MLSCCVALAAGACATVEIDDGDAGGVEPARDAGRKPPPRDFEPFDAGVVAPSDAGAVDRPCDDLAPEGECRGDVLYFCDGVQPVPVDCARMALRCAFNEALMRPACVPPGDPPPEGCTVPPEGECDANGVLYVCEGDAVRVHNCLASGRECDWDAAAGRNACVQPPAEDMCGGVTREGRCVEGRAEVCRAGRLVTEDCPAQGSECELVGGRAICVAPLPPDPCEGIPEGGTCEGDTALYCVEGERQEFDCAALGWICFNIPGVVTLCSDPNAGVDPGGGDPPPLEGEGTPCEVNGLEGTCVRTSDCAGTSTPGHCPGPAEVQCCT
jgi:hypothetical protein